MYEQLGFIAEMVFEMGYPKMHKEFEGVGRIIISQRTV